MLGVILALASHERIFPLTSTNGLTTLSDAKLASSVYRGKRAVVFSKEQDTKFGILATIAGSEFKDGTIDFDVAGELTKGAPQGARSFVGLAFRVGDTRKYECFYLRMTNGRSPDQEIRNHAVQYCASPDYLWDVLRKKRPSRYEAYTDLELGAWTHVKMSIHGTEAKFYVGKITQPTLIVHGLFLGDTHGKLGLWIGGFTRAHFAKLKIRAS